MKKITFFILILCAIVLSGCAFSSNGVLQEAVAFQTSSEGENIRIAIIDSGVNSVFLPKENRFNFTDDSSFDDSIDHGTPIYNLLKHSDIGIVCKADVFSLKVIDESGIASMKALEEALEWCLENQIDIVNMSLSYSIFDENIEALISALVEDGVIVVASISNTSVETDYPSMFDGVIAVGYTENIDLYDDSRSVIFEKNYPIESIGVSNYKKLYTGNSILAPIVTGIIARVISDNQAMKEEGDYVEKVTLIVKEVLTQTDFLIKK